MRPGPHLETLAEADEGQADPRPVDHPCYGAHVREPGEHFGGSRRKAHISEQTALSKYER